MTYTTILNRLQSANEGGAAFNGAKVLETIEFIRELIRKETAAETGESKRYNAAKKILSDKRMKNRPILQKAVIRDGFQTFTNSYVLFMLSDHIPGLLMHDAENDARYPVVSRLVELGRASVCSVSFNAGELKSIIASQGNADIMELFTIGGLACYVDPEMIAAAITIMNYRNDDEITIRYSAPASGGQIMSPLVMERGESLGLVLPMHKPEKDSE